MAIKIWWQSSTPINQPHMADYRRALGAHLDAVRRPDAQVDINGVDGGSLDLHYNAVVALNSFQAGGVLDKLIQAERQGYDAAAIGCFLDPAMNEAREMVRIPVFGLGETSMLMACMFGARFSGVAFHDKQAQYYDRKAYEYGLRDRHIPFGSLGIDLAEVQKGFSDPGAMTETFLTVAKRLARLGAEVILPACACVNAIVFKQKITEVDGALVLDCNAVLLKHTEAMADLAKRVGLSASRRLLFAGPSSPEIQTYLKMYGLRALASGG
jgi:Asp/Glu/hydantoin racemase